MNSAPTPSSARALAYSQCVVVVGQTGDGSFLGAAFGFQSAQLGFELGLEVFASAHGGQLGFVFFGKGAGLVPIVSPTYTR